MRYAIVGGRGLIGRHLATALRARGDDVWVLSRRPSRGAWDLQWDPASGDAGLSELSGVHTVFNLAGEGLAERPWTKARRQRLRDSRVQTTQALNEALGALAAPPKAVIGAGGLGFFGDGGDRFLYDEDEPGEGFLAELCVEWEEAQNAAVERFGTRVCTLRMGMVLAPDGGAFPSMLKPFRYVGGWLGNGRQFTPWIAITDAVGAMVFLSDNDGCMGPFNGCVPDPQRNKAWSKALGRATSRPVVAHAPTWALRGAFGELADVLLLASVRSVPKKLLDAGYAFEEPEPEAAFRSLIAQIDR